MEFLYFAEPGDEFALFFGDKECDRSTVFDFEGFGDFRGCDSAGSWGDIELGDVKVFELLSDFSKAAVEFVLYQEAAAEGRWNLPLGVEESGVGRGSNEVKALRDGGVERGCEYGG